MDRGIGWIGRGGEEGVWLVMGVVRVKSKSIGQEVSLGSQDPALANSKRTEKNPYLSHPSRFHVGPGCEAPSSENDGVCVPCGFVCGQSVV